MRSATQPYCNTVEYGCGSRVLKSTYCVMLQSSTVIRKFFTTDLFLMKTTMYVKVKIIGLVYLRNLKEL